VFEAAVPDELAGPFRESLTKLQHAAPPMPTRDVHRMLVEQFGRRWSERFREFDETPAAAASIGQVHRAVWHDGRDVAVKVQYPGAEEALRSDLRQLSRMSRLLQPLVPGQDVKPLVEELRDRMEEELDYRDEAANQRAFAEVFADDPLITVPRVVASAPRAMVSEWVSGRKLSDVIANGTAAERDQAGALLSEFHYSAPARSGLLHADPHPGNFRMLANGKLGILDFGAVNRMPGGYPPVFGQLTRIFNQGDMESVVDGLRAEGFIRPGIEIDPDALRAFLAPYVEPTAVEEFTFSRGWLRAQAASVTDLRPTNVVRQLNLPASYVLIHRVHAAGVGVLCQLGTTARFRDEAIRWVPGFIDDPNDEALAVP
jgi:predicted unusual protein kinase regulating ubiquinone biosynthesis (AarF/ABC1/UbiB family)